MTTYIPNKIGIPTHWADLGYHQKRKSASGLLCAPVMLVDSTWLGRTTSTDVTYSWDAPTPPAWLDRRGMTGAIVACNQAMIYGVIPSWVTSYALARVKMVRFGKNSPGSFVKYYLKKAKIGKIVAYLFILHCLRTTCSWRAASVTIARGIDRISTKADSSACRYRPVVQAVPTDNNLYHPDSLAWHSAWAKAVPTVRGSSRSCPSHRILICSLLF
jgi:hypothetical protein